MNQGTRGEARIHVNAPPEKLYEMVSDVPRTGEWSPECVRCEWIGGATGPVVGAQFKGSNKRSFMRWTTKPRVVTADPGREFAFVVNVMGLKREMTKWTYRFEPTADGGADVSESFELVNDLPWYIALGDRLMGIKDRKADLEANIQHTLQRIKAAAEGGVPTA